MVIGTGQGVRDVSLLLHLLFCPVYRIGGEGQRLSTYSLVLVSMVWGNAGSHFLPVQFLPGVGEVEQPPFSMPPPDWSQEGMRSRKEGKVEG